MLHSLFDAVYRHVNCAVFSEEVHCGQDIGGWRTIRRTSKEDFEMLCLRVEESKLELEQEQEELSPDELVQVSFQGEMRDPPKGLVGTLLPFQVEGVSWMYHQEVKEELRGGILADGALVSNKGQYSCLLRWVSNIPPSSLPPLLYYVYTEMGMG